MHETGRFNSVVLCADEESRRHPELIGLAGEILESQLWLSVFSSGSKARDHLQTRDASCEAWIASSDDIDSINLAAAIKKDCHGRSVTLISPSKTGSLRSRAGCASIDAVIGIAEFARRYATIKQANLTRTDTTEGFAQRADSDARNDASKTAPAAPSFFSAPQAATTQESAQAFVPSRENGASAQSAASVGGMHLPFNTAKAPTGSGFVVPVVSGSGGAGKSTVSVLAAITAQRAGYRTILVDFDLQFGDVLALLGRDDALRVDEAIAAPISLERVRPDGSLPAVLGAPRRLEQAESVSIGAGALVDILRGSYEVIIANTGGFWAEQHAALLERSDKALFLVDQRPSSLRACQHALELCTRCGIATGPFAFAVNRCSRSALYTSLDVSCALRGAHALELADGGVEVEELLASGQALDLVEDGNALCESLEDALAEMLPGWNERMESGERSSSLPRRLFGRRRGRRRATWA